MIKDYYLVRLFSEKKYRDEANDGINLYIKSIASFWNLENKFQQDYEAEVFKQQGKGGLYLASPDFANTIKKTDNAQEIKKQAH